ncbi:MAG: magnesium transporter CorA family protein, partial [Enterococcus faecium]
IWGMNTGGLPGKSSALGFILVVFGSLIAAAVLGYHLYRKDYTN